MGNDRATHSIGRLGRNLRPGTRIAFSLRRDPGFAARGLPLGDGDLPTHSKWMRKENKIDRAHKIGKTARRTREAQRATAQGCENTFGGQRRGHGDTRVMAAKRVQPMRVGRGD